MGFSEVIVNTERKGESDGKYKMGFSKVRKGKRDGKYNI